MCQVGTNSQSLWDSLGRPRTLAFVGGGGKSTLTHRVAEDIADEGKKVVVTTTTKMLLSQAVHDAEAICLSDDLQVVLKNLRMAFAGGCLWIAVVAGSEMTEHGERALGVPPQWIPELLGDDLADAVVVEADGSRKLPFKAPHIPNEPVLPHAVDAVVAVCGIDCLGSSLSEEKVFRAEVVAGLCGANLGDTVTATMIGKIMGNRRLWCHAMPESKLRFIVAINKVDLVKQEDSVLSVTAVNDVVAAIYEHCSSVGPDGMEMVILTSSMAGCEQIVDRVLPSDTPRS